MLSPIPKPLPTPPPADRFHSQKDQIIAMPQTLKACSYIIIMT